MQGRQPDLSDIARILSLIASPPNRRHVPRPDDLQGRYDFWFDGGACRMVTGGTTYDFADGTDVVDGGPDPWRLCLTITFSDGYQVGVYQTRP